MTEDALLHAHQDESAGLRAEQYVLDELREVLEVLRARVARAEERVAKRQERVHAAWRAVLNARFGAPVHQPACVTPSMPRHFDDDDTL